MVTEPTHTDGGTLDLVLTDVPDFVGRVRSPGGISDHRAVYIDGVVDQPIPHWVCRQEAYPKNSVDWKLVRDVKGLNWNGINRSPCPVSSLNEALFLVILGPLARYHR